jgi:hypothetical protein
MGSFDELHAFFVVATGEPEDQWGALALSPWDLIEALWPLNDVFRPHMARLKTVPYSAGHEMAADAAVLAFAEKGAVAWTPLNAAVWRVLLERHTQMLMTCTANAKAGREVMWTIPAQLPGALRTRAAVLEWWLRMTLPFPVLEGEHLQLPSGTTPGPMRPQ